jgi:hypothetical protein
MLRCVCLLALSFALAPALSAQKAPAGANGSDITLPTSLVNGVYRNSAFGFTYQPPYGWVERTTDMQEDASSSQPQDSKASRNPNSQVQNQGENPKGGSTVKASPGEVLLAVFERPPEVRGDSVNSAVIIAAESAKAYPELKTAADYFTVVEDSAKAQGLAIANEPYEFVLGARQIGREDFSKTLGSLAMKQSTLVILQKGVLLSFTFVAGSDDEISDLIDGLNFAPVRASSAASSPPSSSSRRK